MTTKPMADWARAIDVRRFNSRNPALQGLAEDLVGRLPEDLEEVEDVLTALQQALYRDKLRRRGWRESRSRDRGLPYLTRKRGDDFFEPFPGQDHAQCMVDPDGRRVFVCEPYSMPDMGGVLSFCERHGLECRVRAASVHYPGHTIRLEWRRKEGGFRD